MRRREEVESFEMHLYRTKIFRVMIYCLLYIPEQTPLLHQLEDRKTEPES